MERELFLVCTCPESVFSPVCSQVGSAQPCPCPGPSGLVQVSMCHESRGVLLQSRPVDPVDVTSL